MIFILNISFTMGTQPPLLSCITDTPSFNREIVWRQPVFRNIFLIQKQQVNDMPVCQSNDRQINACHIGAWDRFGFDSSTFCLAVKRPTDWAKPGSSWMELSEQEFHYNVGILAKYCFTCAGRALALAVNTWSLRHRTWTMSYAPCPLCCSLNSV
jgi:hypothetical protein